MITRIIVSLLLIPRASSLWDAHIEKRGLLEWYAAFFVFVMGPAVPSLSPRR